MVSDNKNMQLQGLRGATTSEENTIEAIKSAVNELVFELVNRNNLPPKQIGNFMSEVLVLGFPDDKGEVVLVVPEQDVADGAKLF